MALGQGAQMANKQPAVSASASSEPSEMKRNLLPTISLPKGGGAIRGIGEKFAVNPVTGTGALTVPFASSPGRSGFGPQLSLSYDSGAGNGPFGFGWSLGIQSITRKTDKGLPRYQDGDESDVFLISGAEDLVPILDNAGQRMVLPPRTVHGVEYTVHLYRPRIEGLFARIERWTRADNGISHWRSISRDNVTTLFGFDENSRIADPRDPRRVFSSLLSLMFDDKGNAARYEYAAEDGTGVNRAAAYEANRTDADRQAQRYLKTIRYGNVQPYFPDWSPVGPETPLPTDWHFHLVLDYGDHQANAPTPNPDRPWPVRPDPFSACRAGFEVRTYRRCERVLLFHHFPVEASVGADCLVRSTDFRYSDETAPPDPRNPIYTFLESVTQTGYRRRAIDDYEQRSTPPLEFFYSRPEVHPEILTLTDEDSRANLPEGLDGAGFQWVDLDGEGLSGILTEQNGGWGYKRNLSPLNQVILPNGERVARARFGPLEQFPLLPVPASLGGGQQLLDLSGSGRLDLVAFDGPNPGFFKHTADSQWEPFHTFASLLRLNWSESNLKFVDVTGDGRADVLMTEDDVYTFYPSLGEEGFGEAERIFTSWDEEQGPHVVFADGTQTVSLADISGDGLSDIVRVRNGEVCYWPNLGYGRFGAKVTMDNAPRFTDEERFDPRRIRWADVDGSGTTDLLYIGDDGVQICFNRSGNSWAAPHRLAVFPSADSMSSVLVADLLGNGTACLVWSSPLPGESYAPLRYVDLMGSQKPHLMVRTRNNLGAETRLSYAPSTRFYLEDKRAGRPWITRLPFPVHVLERVENYDWIGRRRFVSRYAYHHGYFDGEEREFRGFGMVEQRDTETHLDDMLFPDVESSNEDAASFVPPMLTRTWFHTGAFIDAGNVSRQYEHEYWVEPDLRGDAPADVAAREAMLLPDTVLEAGLDPDEVREAYRALKGSPLRIEVYSEDGTPRAEHPYTVTEQNFSVRRLQERGPNQHTVFLTHPRESLAYHYERNPADPRVSHALTLEVDPYGNILKSLAVGYGRRSGQSPLQGKDKEKQEQVLITYTENDVTNAIDAQVNDPNYDPDNYRTPLPSETRSYEVTGFESAGDVARFSFDDFAQNGFQPLLTLSEIKYEEPTDYSKKQKRLIEHVRTLYRPDDLGVSQNDPLTLLPLRVVQPVASPGESYKLAFTPGLAKQIFVDSGKLSQDDLDSVLANEGKYVHSEGDNNWWIPSGRMFYSPDADNDASTERAYARQHFFLPHRYRDPFHTNAVSTESFVTYDTYDLLMLETRDPLGNRVTVGERLPNGAHNPIKPGNDYRVLQPSLITDPNGNRTEVAFDALGMVAGTAVMGKATETLGDMMDASFEPDPTQAQLDAFMANPREASVNADESVATQIVHDLLGKATTRILYDLDRFNRLGEPPFAATIARETHVSELQQGQQTKIQISFSYSDGFGREIQKKIQAEPGPVPLRDAKGKIIVGADGQQKMTPNDISPRSVGSGWTVFNNKGKPVRQYEPFFTDTHRFEFDVRIGVSPVLFYDPAERVIATLHPNHTYEKAIFDPWEQVTWDVNDTIKVPDNPGDPAFDPKNDLDVGQYFERVANDEYLPTWYDVRTDAAKALQVWPDTDAQGQPMPDNAKRRTAEKSAAEKAAVHADTQAVAHFDSLGRTFLTVAHNKFKRSDTPPADPPMEEFYRTSVLFDIEGNQREVIDAKDRVVMRYDYDMLGNRIHQASMEAGERWILNDVAGKPIRAWDSRNHQFRTDYDPLRRPTESFLREGDGPELLVGRTVYGEARPNPETNNLRGKVVKLFDQAGVVTSDDYDFKGNPLHGQRQLVREYKTTLDWSAAVPLEAPTYISHTIYDALNRPTELTAPDNSVIRPTYNEANLLERVEANLRGTAVATPFVTDIDYDAKGQRTLIEYGNGVMTTYEYDPLTFRLSHLQTLRGAEPLQDLRYTFDPVGNITTIRDDAQQTLYFRNRRVEPSAEYTYDAVYWLIEATGREHLGQTGSQPNSPTPPDAFNSFHTRRDHPGDGNEMGTYVERYLYDAVGNILAMQHRGSDPAHPGWTRAYTYHEPSLLEPGKTSNRLTSTQIGNGPPEMYTYDEHGNMTTMPHLPLMQWDYRDQLQATAQQVVNNGGTPEITYYAYDASGQRVRKVTERQAAAGQTPTRKAERIYIGGFEVFHEFSGDGNTIELERETLHIMDDKQRFALMETRTQGNDPTPQQLIRYQFVNHLGSARLELDDQAQIISYEEYYPYGNTSYQAVRNKTETPKRYRNTGKERDEESGLYYHGGRYSASWIGRWISPDPLFSSFVVDKGTNRYAAKDSEKSTETDQDRTLHSNTGGSLLSKNHNLYCFVNNNPLIYSDPDGFQSMKEEIENWISRIAFSGATEVLGYLNPGFSQGRPLTKAEQNFLRPFFGTSVDYNKVNIVEEATGIWNLNDRKFTLKNKIFMKSSPKDPQFQETLLHEMVHIWQYQTAGIDYAILSLKAQALEGDEEAYNWQKPLLAGLKWSYFNPEAQAQLISALWAQGKIDISSGKAKAKPGIVEQADLYLDSKSQIIRADKTNRVNEFLDYLRAGKGSAGAEMFDESWMKYYLLKGGNIVDQIVDQPE